MKSITVITFLLAFTKLTFGQQVIYKPVFIDQCSGLKKDSVSWWLTGSNNQFYAPGILRDDIVVLPDTGEYFLFSENIEMSFSIQDTGIISDTLYTARILHVADFGEPPYSAFLDCNTVANGTITDFYDSRNIRLTGTFSNGQPVDTLKMFHRNGMMAEMIIPQKEDFRYIGYYKNGNIRIDHNPSKKYEKYYYETGALNSYTSWKRNHNVKRTEYLSNGLIKLRENPKQQTKYDSTGNIIQTTTRKEVMILKRFLKKETDPWFEYQSCLMDSSGNKLALVQYGGDYYSSTGYYPESMAHIEDFQFEKIILYKNGEVIESVDFSNTEQKSGQSAIIQKLLQIESSLGK